VPSVSKKQKNFMAAAAHNPEFAKKAGVPVSVAKEFNAADKGKKFKSGGNVADLKKLFKGKDTYKEELKEGKAIKSGKITPEQYAKGEEMEKKMKKVGSCKMSSGGKAKKYAGGGETSDEGNDTIRPEEMKGKGKRFAKGGVTRADGCVKKGHTKGKIL